MAVKSLVSDDVLEKIRQSLVENAQELAPTKKLKTPGVIKAYTVRHKNGEITIRMWADIIAAPEARAYEFGSGIHRTSGRPRSKNEQPDGTILIRPKNKKFLAFTWDKISLQTKRVSRILHFKKNPDWRDSKDIVKRFPSYAGELPNGKSLFNYVHHPGVEVAHGGRGYLRLGASVALRENTNLVLLSMANVTTKAIKASFAKQRSKN